MEKTMQQFQEWLQTAKPNERIEYYEGYIGKDRCLAMNRLEIGKLANLFLKAYENKLVVLFQKRVSYGDTQKDPVFKYIAQKI